MVFWQFFVLIAKVPVFYSISQKRMNNSDIIREEYVMLALYFAGIIAFANNCCMLYRK